MQLDGGAAAPFPRRFVVRYSLEEARSIADRRSRTQMSLAQSGSAWVRLIVLALLVAGLALVAWAYGALSPSGLPLVAALLSGAFIAGVYAGWTEIGSLSRRTLSVLHDRGSWAFGPWEVVVTEEAVAGAAEGS